MSAPLLLALAAAAGALLGWAVGMAAAQAVIRWDRREKTGGQYRITCTADACSWGADLDGPAHLIEGAARMLTDGHTERRGHATKTERITR